MADNGDEGLKIEINTVINPNPEDAKKAGVEDGEAYAKGFNSTAKTDEKYVDNQKTSREATGGVGALKDGIKDYLKDENNQKKLITKGVKQAETAISTSLKKGFGIVEEIYAKLKSASPLLQTIESLFNLAMTLFFMPLGNKLAEVLIPATIELLDKVVDMWDAFEGKSLGEMFSIAISQGVKLFAEYFNNIGETLKEQGGMVANIGRLLQTVGDFITNHGAALLEFILNTVTIIVSHLKEFISIWMAMKAAEIAMQAAGLAGEALGVKTTIGVVALSALAAGAASYGTLTGLGMAEGGYVPAKAGGSLKVLGEGGKGEYVIPEDKMGEFGGTVTINMYGWTNDDAKKAVEDAVNSMVSQSRIRGSF